jgi:hypothetical protein
MRNYKNKLKTRVPKKRKRRNFKAISRKFLKIFKITFSLKSKNWKKKREKRRTLMLNLSFRVMKITLRWRKIAKLNKRGLFRIPEKKTGQKIQL